MAGGKEAEKAAEAAIIPVEISSSRLAKDETASREDASSFGTSVFNLSGRNQSPLSAASVDLNAYYNPGTYNFVYSGYSPSYPSWNNHVYPTLNEASTLPYNVPLLKPCSHLVGTSDRNQSIQNVPSVFQGQNGHVTRDSYASIRTLFRPWVDNKVSERKKVNQRRHSEGFCDVICGPRANRKKSFLSSPEAKKCFNLLVHSNRFNLPDFQTKYEHARFFMIKSYNEDDVHKSIKYQVWASTPSGNKKLDDAFYDAEGRTKGGATKCPIFLFFSVNTSGQFVGVAEMTGHVDFKKSMDFWQEERWSGFFPVRWHIIRDVPNLEFRSIILENNDNRPVFFSRDTQEIGLPQGLKMLQIFKNYPAEASILDDFDFYDAREKSLRSRRGLIPSLVHTATRTVELMHLEDAMQRVDLSSKPRSLKLI